MIEKNTIGGRHRIRLAVVDRCPVGKELGNPIRGAWIKRRTLILWRLERLAVKLRRGRLIKTHGLLHAENAHRFKKPQSDETSRVGGIFWRLEPHLHMTLRS